MAAFFHSLSYPFARVNYYTPRPLLSPYCMFGGFFNLYTSWIEVLALTCLTLGSFINGVLQNWKHLPRWAEIIYIGLPYALPLLWCWIPFINRSFGSGSAWCDIRTINVDCSRFIFGAVLRFIIWYIPLAVILIFLFVFALVVLFRVRKALKSEETMEQWQKEDLREVRYLVIYPIIYLVLNIFSFINRLDIAIQEENALLVFYYLHILTSPFRGAVIALAFAFDPDTRKRLANPRTLCVSSRVREYSIRSSEENFDTNKPAEPVQ